MNQYREKEKENMDQHEHQVLKIMSQFMKSNFIKKLTQLLLSISVLSFLLFNPKLSFVYPFNFYFSTIPLQFFSHPIDKNCIFLLCNGLLVFVTKYSGLISSSPKNDHTNIESFKDSKDDRQPLVLNSKETYLELEKQVLVESIDAQQNVIVENERENEATNGQVEFKETMKCIAQDDEEGGGGEREGGFLIGKEGKESDFFVWEHNEEEIEELDDEFPLEEEEEDENGALSTEELNKKFEEFIRKMKEELRIEAQEQLIMVE